MTPAPRVILIVRDRWLRALLRVELRERGYDAVGARDLEEAALYPAAEAGRGGVGLVVLDRDVIMEKGGRSRLARLLQRHGGPAVVLRVGGEEAPPPGPWAEVVRDPAVRAGGAPPEHGPANTASVVAAVRRRFPLPEGARLPLEE